MAKILLLWDYDADMIECPQDIADNVYKYQHEFDLWLYSPDSKHDCLTTDSEGNLAFCFDGETFLNWLNTTVLANSEEKARFIKRGFVPDKSEMELVRINF